MRLWCCLNRVPPLAPSSTLNLGSNLVSNLAVGGAGCSNRLTDAYSQAVSALAEDAPPSARDQAIRLLKACERPNSTDDVAILLGSAMGVVQSLVQYNNVGSAHDVGSFCAVGDRAAQAGATALEAFGAQLDETFEKQDETSKKQDETSEKQCLVSTLDTYMKPLYDISFDTGKSDGVC